MTKKTRNKTVSRRKLLASTGIAAAGLSAPMTGFALGKTSQSDINTSFDPSNKKAVKAFLKELNTLEQKPQRRTVKRLRTGQRKAVQEFLKGAEIVVRNTEDLPQPTSSGVETQGHDGYTTRSFTPHVALLNATGDELWRYYQELTYDWWYNTDVRVASLVSRPEVYYPFWSYLGENDRYTDDNGTYADSFTQGKFQVCLTKVGCYQTKYPYIETRCFSKAGARVERKSQ